MMMEPRALWASWEHHEEKYSIFTSQILFLISNFSMIWLVGCMLANVKIAMQHWNRNQVYSSITPNAHTMLAPVSYCEPYLTDGVTVFSTVSSIAYPLKMTPMVFRFLQDHYSAVIIHVQTSTGRSTNTVKIHIHQNSVECLMQQKWPHSCR